MDVVGFFFGVDNQNAAWRIAFCLRGEKCGCQLTLAGSSQRIGF
jgi:hypothetical protein